MLKACGQLVETLSTRCAQSIELSEQSTAGPKYLTSQVFFMRSLFAGPAKFNITYAQTKSTIFNQLIYCLSSVSPALTITTKLKLIKELT